VLGGPGSGKGTQCEVVLNDFNAEHLIPGEMLRREVRSGSQEGVRIEEILLRGEIVPSSVTVPLLRRAIESSRKRLILVDGFPRTMENRDEFIRKTARDCDLLLFFDCPQEELKRRLLLRGKTSGRSDDNIETIMKRFETYRRATMPVVDYYRERGMAEDINAARAIDEVTGQTRDALARLTDSASRISQSVL